MLQSIATKVQITIVLLTTLCIVACGGGGGESTSQQLGIAGKIVAAGSANADVTVIIGETIATVKANENGEYLINIAVPENPGSTPIGLVGKLIGERSFIELASNLGSVQDIIADAGNDLTLDFKDNARANISSLSTAESTLLQKLGIARAKSLNLAEEIDPQEALDLAASIELLIQQPENFTLPEGSNTTLELAQNEPARSAFIQDLRENNPDALQQATESLLSNEDILSAAEDVLEDKTIIALGLPSDESGFCWNGCPTARAFELKADNSASSYSSSDSEVGSWALDGTKQVISLPNANSFAFDGSQDCNGDGSSDVVAASSTVTGYDLVQLTESTLAITEFIRINRDNCPQSPQENISTTMTATIAEEQQIDISLSELSDQQWVLPVFNPSYTLQQRQPFAIVDDFVSFQANGSSSVRILGGTPNWRIENGLLILEQEGEYLGNIKRIRSVDEVAAIYLAEYATNNGKYISASFGYPADPLAQFIDSESAGRYFFNGIGPDPFLDEQAADDPRLLGDRFRLDLDRNGEWGSDEILNGELMTSSSSAKIIGWQVNPQGELTYSRYQYFPEDASNIQFGGYCPDINDPECVKVVDARLILANRIGNRLYTVRRRDQFNFFGSGFIQNAIVFDYLPLSDSQTTAPSTQELIASMQGDWGRECTSSGNRSSRLSFTVTNEKISSLTESWTANTTCSGPNDSTQDFEIDFTIRGSTVSDEGIPCRKYNQTITASNSDPSLVGSTQLGIINVIDDKYYSGISFDGSRATTLFLDSPALRP